MPEERGATGALPLSWISAFCRRHKMAALTIRQVGVWCSRAAVVAFGLVVITDKTGTSDWVTTLPAGISFGCSPWR
jgi:hypothetical protein